MMVKTRNLLIIISAHYLTVFKVRIVILINNMVAKEGIIIISEAK